MNKAEAVRKYLEAHSEAGPTEAARALAGDGVKVSAKYVSRVKIRSRKKLKASRLRPYPARTLEDALEIPRVMFEYNGKKLWSAGEVARASLHVTETNKTYIYAAAAARDHGLVVRVRGTGQMELTALAREILAAVDTGRKKEKLLEAFLAVKLYRQVFERYQGLSLPEGEALSRALERDFGLEAAKHEEFLRLYRANCAYVDLESGLTGVEGREERDPPTRKPQRASAGTSRRAKVQKAYLISRSSKEQVRPEGFFSELLRALISPAASAAGLTLEDGPQKDDELLAMRPSGSLLSADLAIVELSEPSPRVFFELGLAVARGIPLALLKAEDAGPVFGEDGSKEILAYNPKLWPTTLEKDIPRVASHLRRALRAPETRDNPEEMKAGVA